MQRPSIASSMLSLLLAVALLVPLAAPQPAQAAELLMFELRGCPWCKLWRAQVGPAYPNSAEGQRAPLRTVDIKGPPPEGVVLDKPVTSAPTFVLVEEGREVGRITGYPGADFFWALLEDLIAKLDPAPASPSAPGQRSL